MKRAPGGFTLIELMIVVAIIAIVAAIAIPNLLKSRIVANHNNAGAALKQLTSHEATWKQGDYDRNGQGDYWTRDMAGFYCVYDSAGKPYALVDAGLAFADKAPGMAYAEVAGGPRPKQGYYYQAMTTDAAGAAYVIPASPPPTAKNSPAGASTNSSLYGFTAFPGAYGADGVLGFIMGEDGIIWQKDLGSATPTLDRKAASPDAAGSGWSQFGG